MKAEELRIGNFLPMEEFLNGNNYCIVKEISEGKIKTICPNNQITGVIYEPKPISLTKEWLVNFGFTGDFAEYEKDGINLDCEYTDKGEWNLFLKGNNIKPVESKNEYVCHYIPKIELKYVHQLQNLYFALIGKELEIK